MSNYNQSQAGTAYPVEENKETQAHFTAPPPAGYPAKDENNQAPDDTAAEKTQSRGDGFFKGCLAALCCCLPPIYLPPVGDFSISREKEHKSEEEHFQTTTYIDQDDSTGLHLLLQCAACVAVENLKDAGQLLPEKAELSFHLAHRLITWGLTSSTCSQLGSSAPTWAPTPLSPHSSRPTSKSSSMPSHHQKPPNALQVYYSITP
ncbi:GRAS domain-containing protein [Abeliophyllum distichum]|uniref:GRAS domain-containing protein n=1 Tax=Abeliophyllum distichum TaxID=126358 RepID=A0ABD1PMN6_9LAMI